MRRILFLALFLSAARCPGEAAPRPSATAQPPVSSNRSTPGVEVAQAISTITGVAISPLMGVSGVGAWKYYHTPPAQRTKLPWYAQPWFWGPAILVVLLVLLKDTFGAALPTVMKKPFDFAELIENKISGLVVAGAFVPLIAAIFRAGGDDGALLHDLGAATIDLTPLLSVVTVPLAVVAFVIVWMVSHVIHVLILVSPFTTVDTALKAFRLFLLSTVAGTAFVNPYAGAVWSLVIVAICWFLAGWAFRLMVFGAVFAWDFGTFRKNHFKLGPEVNWVFTARPIDQTPIRTYGKLSRGSQGELVLSYRPWLVLSRRTLTLPQMKYAVGRRLIHSELVQVEGESIRPCLTLPPRYRTHEEEFSSIYRLSGVCDLGVVKGFKAFWRWLRGFFGFRSEVPTMSL